MSTSTTNSQFADRDTAGLAMDLNDNGDGISFNVAFRTDGGAVAATMHVLVDVYESVPLFLIFDTRSVAHRPPTHRGYCG